MADAGDLKSPDRKVVWVRVPPSVFLVSEGAFSPLKLALLITLATPFGR